MKEITKDQVEELAKLARLGLTEDEKKSLAKEMTAFLNYVEMLQEVDTKNIKSTNETTGLRNVYRKDEIKDCNITPEDLLANVPELEGTFIKVKKVLE